MIRNKRRNGMEVKQCTDCHEKLCLAKVPMFVDLSQNDLNQILKQIKHKAYKKGDIIFQEGMTSDVLYFINTGSVKLYNYTKDGKEQILHVLSVGDFFGELSLIKASKYQFYAKAIEGVNLCILTKEEMTNIIMQNPEIGIKLLETLGKRLTAAERLAQNLATNDIDSRLAYLLVSFLDRDLNVEMYTPIEIKLPLNREEMANSIGVTRETISRKMKKFEEEGLIQLIGTKSIRILDLEGLKKYL